MSVDPPPPHHLRFQENGRVNPSDMFLGQFPHRFPNPWSNRTRVALPVGTHCRGEKLLWNHVVPFPPLGFHPPFPGTSKSLANTSGSVLSAPDNLPPGPLHSIRKGSHAIGPYRFCPPLPFTLFSPLFRRPPHKRPLRGTGFSWVLVFLFCDFFYTEGFH